MGISIYLYVYIYIYRWREKIHIYGPMKNIHYMYIYIYLCLCMYLVALNPGHRERCPVPGAEARPTGKSSWKARGKKIFTQLNDALFSHQIFV